MVSKASREKKKKAAKNRARNKAKQRIPQDLSDIEKTE